ncbi:MAG: hypothetical protein V1809_07675 [Planctomycetota bacterium]
MTRIEQRARFRKVLKVLTRAYPKRVDIRSAPKDILSHALWLILSQGDTRSRASALLRSLSCEFPDWNELRVTALSEIAVPLKGGHLANAKAAAIRRFLHAVYRRQNDFNLEELGALNRTDFEWAIRRLDGLEGGIADWILLERLGMPFLPADANLRRVMRRIGLLKPGHDINGARRDFENMVPRPIIPWMAKVLTLHAETVCTVDDPACRRCPLREVCEKNMEELISPVVPIPAAPPKPILAPVKLPDIIAVTGEDDEKVARAAVALLEEDLDGVREEPEEPKEVKPK